MQMIARMLRELALDGRGFMSTQIVENEMNV